MFYLFCNKIGLNQLAYNDMTTRQIKKRWYVDFWHNRQRIRVPSPENSKAGAEAYEAHLRHQLAIGMTVRSRREEQKQQERGQKFKDFAWVWFETYAKPNNKPSEAKNKLYALRSDLIPFFGETPIDKIDTLQVERYKAKKIGQVSNKTINNHLIILGKCLRDAQEWHDLLKIPKIKKLKVPPQKFDFLSKEESKLLLAHLGGVWREIVLTALKTGLRRGELVALQWSDIDWNNSTLTVRHSWCETQKTLGTPKSNRDRHIPLTSELYQMLAQRKKTDGFIFTDENNKRIESKRINRAISIACTKAGLRGISCHVLRHSFASHLIMAGESMKAVQELLGHESIQTTMRYAHLAPSSLRNAIRSLEPENKILLNFGQPVGNFL